MLKQTIAPILASVLLVACSDDDNALIEEPLSFERVQTFDFMLGESPQGIASLPDGSLLVSFPFLKQLRVYDPSGESLIRTIDNTPSFSFVGPSSDGNVLLGSAAILDPAFDPDSPDGQSNAEIFANHGVWSFDPDTYELSLVSNVPPSVFPTHFAELPDGTILMSDIFGQTISTVDRELGLLPWKSDPLLSGDPDENRPGPEGRPPFPVGIEGIQVRGNYVYGVVADYGRLIRIPINADGSSGDIEVLLDDRELLLGIAHFVFDNNGDIIANSGFQSKIWKIDVDNGYDVSLLADNDSEVQVDTPGMLARGVNSNAPHAFFTNNSFVMNDQKRPPSPGITRINAAFQ